MTLFLVACAYNKVLMDSKVSNEVIKLIQRVESHCWDYTQEWHGDMNAFSLIYYVYKSNSFCYYLIYNKLSFLQNIGTFGLF